MDHGSVLVFARKSQAKEQLNDSRHVSRFFFLRFTLRELQSRVKISFRTVFLGDISCISHMQIYN